MAARHPRLDLDIQRRLQLLEAVAREQVLQMRRAQVLEVLALSEDRLEPARALEIYIRVHSVKSADARVLGDRVFASLAEREGTGRLVPSDDPPEEAAPAARRGLFRQLRRRLRGRVNTRLRRQIELHTGRSQVRLLHLHIDQALRFLDVLPDRWPVADVVNLYAERLGLDEPLSGTLYLFVLERLARAELPPPNRPAEPPQRSAQDGAAHPLRIVTSGS